MDGTHWCATCGMAHEVCLVCGDLVEPSRGLGRPVNAHGNGPHWCAEAAMQRWAEAQVREGALALREPMARPAGESTKEAPSARRSNSASPLPPPAATTPNGQATVGQHRPIWELDSD